MPAIVRKIKRKIASKGSYASAKPSPRKKALPLWGLILRRVI